MTLVSLPMDTTTHFLEAVHEIVERIPSERVTTYGAIAHYVGVRGSTQMVRWALHQATQCPDIPAHRVVNRHGLLTGKHYFVSKSMMGRSPASESVRFCSDQVQGFA
jgi:methylated-DNA-protein-cysteine methyltransferase-like protein